MQGKMPFGFRAIIVHMKYWSFEVFLTIFVFLSATFANATASDLCLTAARTAAAQSEVPSSVLIAISQTETGRTRDGITQPWPWAVNINGEGHWFESAQNAIAFAQTQYDHGARSFDVGCFQLNYRWHGENFSSIEAMFDPIEGANYAANFLTRLYTEKGNWSEAAGAYHSRTTEYSTRYRARFDVFYANMVAAESESPSFRTADSGSRPALEILQHNTYPLLKSGSGQSGLGSLVPLTGGS